MQPNSFTKKRWTFVISSFAKELNIVAVGTNTNGRLEYLRVEASDGPIRLVQVVVEEWWNLRRRTQHGAQIASFCLVLT
jgi:hypothetical protein